MKTFYLKHHLKPLLLALLMLTGLFTWGQSETLTITRANFPSGSLAYGTDDLWTASTSGGEIIEGYFDLFSTQGQTTMQTRTTPPIGSYPHNTIAIPGNITKITLVGGGTGTARSWTPYLSTSPLTKANYNTGANQGSQTATSNSASTEWNIDANLGFTYFYLHMTGGAAYLSSITIEYEATNSNPTLSVTPNTANNFEYIVDNGPSSYQTFSLSGLNFDGTQSVLIGLEDGADFEISFNPENGYDSILELGNYDGTAIDIYARLKAGKGENTYYDILSFISDTNEIDIELNGQVLPAPNIPVVTEADLEATVGTPFSYQILATEDPTSYDSSFEVFPAGLSLDSETGIISGTPTIAGEFLFGVTASNISGTSAEAAFTLTISKGTQTLSGFVDTTKYTTDVAFTFPETTNAGLVVEYISDDDNVASVSGNMITLNGAGTTTIWAMSDGNSNWEDFIETITLTVSEGYTEGLFQKINSIDELTDGFYIVTNPQGAYAMTNNHTGTYLQRIDSEAIGGYTIDPEASTVWFIGTDNGKRTIYSQDSGKYISYTGSSNNVQIVNAVSSDNQRWNITFDQGVFKVNNAAVTNRYLQYNASSPRFACYTNSQQHLAFYKITDYTAWSEGSWSNGMPDATKVALFFDDYTISSPMISKGVITQGPSVTVTITNGASLTSEGSITNVLDGVIVVENDANIIQNLYKGSNFGNIEVHRNSSPIKHLDYTIWSSPVTGQGLQAFSPLTLPVRITTYNTSTDQWVQTPSAGGETFVTGKGYMFRAPNDFITTPYVYDGTFTGEPNNGDITVNFSAGTYQSLGNPYSSNINLDTFLTENPQIGPLYFWTNTNPYSGGQYIANNWATYSLLGGSVPAANSSKISNGIIATGQGFVAETDGVITSANFNNSMRTVSAPVFFRNTNTEKHRVWLALTNGETQQYIQILVGYMEGATNGKDTRLDAKIFDYDGAALYSIIDGTTEKFSIQGRALPFDDQDVVPLGLKTITNGNYGISLIDFDGLFTEGQGIYIKDNLTQTIYNLKDGDYNFTSDAGTFTDRFELVFRQTMGVGEHDANIAWTAVSKDNKLSINTQGFELKNVAVYDMLGRVVYQNSANANQHTASIAGARGVLIVKVITTDNKELTKKIIR